MDAGFEYEGDELSLFKAATNWKNYFRKTLAPYISGTVLEVGAGLGGTTIHLFNERCSSWTCLEPDPSLVAEMQRVLQEHGIAGKCHIVTGSIENIGNDALFDAILYIDVLEHIEHDREQLEQAAKHLRPGGHLIVLSPAYQYLYSKFDKAIGHFRRYSLKSLSTVFPPGLQLVEKKYLDGLGVLTSLANKWFLKQDYPTEAQINLWDKKIVPISRTFDRITGFSFGRSVIVVGRKTN